MWQRSRGIAQEPVVQLMLDTPNARPDLSRFAVSGDGTRFAFSTDEGIAYRGAGQREYRLLAGTQAGESPSFSPDGDWIVYQANGKLRKIPVAGGSPIALFPTDSVSAGRVSWGDDGTIVFETSSVIALLPAGGALRVLKKATSAEQPRLTPDGRGILYVDNGQRAKLMYYDFSLDSAFTLLEESTEASRARRRSMCVAFRWRTPADGGRCPPAVEFARAGRATAARSTTRLPIAPPFKPYT